MAQWGLEGAYLHWEPESRPALWRQSKPVLWEGQGGTCSWHCPLPHEEGGTTAQDLVPLPGRFQPHAALIMQL